MAGAEVTNPGEGSLEHRVSTMAAQTIDAWRTRGVEGTVASPAGEIPASVAASILSIELLLHAWDFAQASGQRVAVSDEVVAWVAGRAAMVVPGSRGRGAFADEVPAAEGPGVEVKPMFGQLGAFVNGNMYAGMLGEQVGVKPSPEVLEEVLSLPGAGPFGPAERPMKGWAALPLDLSDEEATAWLERGREHVATLPPKARKK